MKDEDRISQYVEDYCKRTGCRFETIGDRIDLYKEVYAKLKKQGVKIDSPEKLSKEDHKLYGWKIGFGDSITFWYGHIRKAILLLK